MRSESSSGHGFDPVARLNAREDVGLRRELSPHETVGARTRWTNDPCGAQPVFAGDTPAIVMASNNYLGLAGDDRVTDAAGRCAELVGAGAGASRLVTGDTPAHRALERDLARTKGTKRALTFSSGYAANVGTITALDPDVVFSDVSNHASIIDGCRLASSEVVVYDHCDPDALETAMADRANELASTDSWLVVTDSVFSMDGDVAPLSSLCDVAEQYGAWMMVDEAHATGLYADGGGIVQRDGLSDRIQIQLGTLSKALGAQGGYVAASEPVVELLANEARSFVYSTGLAPPAAAAAQTALSIARHGDRRQQLWSNVDRLRTGLTAAGYDIAGSSQILPVIVGDRQDAVALAAELAEEGIVAPAIRPPTVPEGTSRIRLAPMATHTSEDIDRCVKAFERAEVAP
ncbi:aminotransferase class I/II-fold pyridoxal phosphate-dependent enzyme [Halocatena halophila]|uniref:aminotransferase class I/II-fold pyridoxal phosphate-dependent enzyme n=1 Tax=Halocatena halophila TaxID=2814576 RepID=UPI002ECFB2C5